MGTVLANDIKRNLAILEDTLGQCTNETSTRYDGDVSELRIQLERMMVRVTEEFCFCLSIRLFFIGCGKTS